MSFEDNLLLGVKSVKNRIWASGHEKDWKCVIKVAKENENSQKADEYVCNQVGEKKLKRNHISMKPGIF